MKRVRVVTSLILTALLLFLLAGCAKTPVDVTDNEPTTAVTQVESIPVVDTMPENEPEEEIGETMPEAPEPYSPEENTEEGGNDESSHSLKYEDFDWSSIPDYAGQDVVVINDDEPLFEENEKVYQGTYIELSELDSLGRCGVAKACVGQETEPTEKRGDISKVYPSGWKQKQLSNGGWLYNRSHLLMYALTGLNAEPRNLITGTEHFNQKSMLGYETMVTYVIDNFNAHVLYRVTPVFDGDNLVAKGVLMEAYCIEYPKECTYCVFVYNVQPGVTINYATGVSTED